MTQTPEPYASANLTDCDREPIHLLGSIQGFGFLLALSADWIVVRASENIESLIGASHADVLGQPIENIIPTTLLHDVRGRLQIGGGPDVVERLFSQLLTNEKRFDIAVHQTGSETVMEFEPSVDSPLETTATLKSILSRIEKHQTQQDLCREAARQVRAMTGFDRVMMYRFDDTGAGEVIAESAAHGLMPYLGLRYPAADIPVQARALYERNLLRIIADVDATPVPVTPAVSLELSPLDLSMSGLRAVSPIHLEYLRNMGVRASMSISILRNGKLWGLIACHATQPHRPSYQIRSMAELFGQMFSYLLEGRQREEEARHDAHARDVHHRIASAFATAGATLKNLPDCLAGMSGYIAADGFATYQSGEVSLTGLTPTRDEFVQIVRFLNKTASGRVFSTHCLAETFPPSRTFANPPAGLLSIPVSRSPRDYVVFFRREIEKTVNWAGNPTKTEVLGPNGPRLTPRKSFELWRETVRDQSERWSERELRAAEALRLTLVELVLRISEQASANQAVAEHRSEIVIAELNHRVRNILGLVRGLIAQIAEHAADVEALVGGLGDRISSLARAYDMLSINSGRPGSLRELLKAEIDAYDRWQSRLVLTGPDVLLRVKVFTTMALVIHELMTNARKYGALSVPDGRIAVYTSRGAADEVVISWRESGGPAVVPPTRRGFGTTVLEQLIPFEVDGTSVASYPEDGFTFDIRLPAAVAECIDYPATLELQQIQPAGHPDGSLLVDLLNSCLLVEDNMFIALDTEDMLRRLGATRVDIARSVAEALSLRSERQYTFALLDVSLGAGNSLPVARALLARGTPFVFGTGYGEGHSLDASLATVPIISKPYHPDSLRKTLMRLAAAEGFRASP